MNIQTNYNVYNVTSDLLIVSSNNSIDCYVSSNYLNVELINDTTARNAQWLSNCQPITLLFEYDSTNSSNNNTNYPFCIFYNESLNMYDDNGCYVLSTYLNDTNNSISSTNEKNENEKKIEIPRNEAQIFDAFMQMYKQDASKTNGKQALHVVV